jgi:hypothetical protein
MSYEWGAPHGKKLDIHLTLDKNSYCNYFKKKLISKFDRRGVWFNLYFAKPPGKSPKESPKRSSGG